MKYTALLLTFILCSCAAVTGIGNPGVTFYGLVVDETGTPVADSSIYIDAMTSILQIDSSSGEESRMKTDSRGRFHFSKSGLSILVEVTQPAYKNRSSVVLTYDKLKKRWSQETSQTKPYVFVLKKKKES